MTRLAAAQMKSTANLDENYQQIRDLAELAQAQKADILVLPEECLTLKMPDEAKTALSQDKQVVQTLSDIARQYNLWLIAGSVPQDYRDGKYYATLLAFDNEGTVQGRYQKIHLFDVEVGVGKTYHESNQVLAGKDPKLLTTPFGKIGLSICYDLRFPELYRHYMRQGADILLVPSAFTPQTGLVHWHTLLKARAIENLCYVVAPNQNGLRANGEGTFGHSLIIGPWGEVLAELETGIGIVTAEINLATLKQVRNRFPALEHQRLP